MLKFGGWKNITSGQKSRLLPSELNARKSRLLPSVLKEPQAAFGRKIRPHTVRNTSSSTVPISSQVFGLRMSALMPMRRAVS